MAEANIATFALQPITEIRHMPKSRDSKLLVYTGTLPQFYMQLLYRDTLHFSFTSIILSLGTVDIFETCIFALFLLGIVT